MDGDEERQIEDQECKDRYHEGQRRQRPEESPTMIRRFARRLESLETAAKPPMISTWAEFMADEDNTRDLSPEFSISLEQLLEKQT